MPEFGWRAVIDRRRSLPLSTLKAWRRRWKTTKRWKRSCATIKDAGRFIACHRDRAPRIPTKRSMSAFLNIKPLPLIRKLGLLAPEFSPYQRSEEDDSFQALNLGRVTGALLYNGGYVTLVGERSRRGFAKIGILTWAHVGNIFDEHETTIFGLSCIPNSEGRRIIGAYFIARFIPGSDEFNEDKYRITRENELKKMGSVVWKSLKESIEDVSIV